MWRGRRRWVGVAVGAALLAETADHVGLAAALSRALGEMRERRGRDDPGRVILDRAVMPADGGDCLADLRTAMRDQQPCSGEVASDSTAFRTIQRIAQDPALLEAWRGARAAARSWAWELGVRPAELVIDVDATLLTAYSEKRRIMRRGTTRAGSGSIRCWRSWTDRAKRSRDCCDRGTPVEHRCRAHRRGRPRARATAAGGGSPTRRCGSWCVPIPPARRTIWLTTAARAA